MLEIHPGLKQYNEAIWQGVKSDPSGNQLGGDFLIWLAQGSTSRVYRDALRDGILGK